MRTAEKIARAAWAGLALLALGLAPGAAGALEFSSPPGMNVPRQEELLKEEVTRLAKDLVGENLVDVVVSIGYARMDTQELRKGEQAKVKLPGFNRFLTGSAADKLEIKAEFTRLRQIFVMISEGAVSDAKAIELELTILGKFDRRKGDWVQVISVAKPPDDALAAENGKKEGENGKGDKKEGEEEKPVLAEGEKGEEGGAEGLAPRRPRMRTPFDEPRSTAHLLRARTAYFKQNYNRALDHILRAIRIEPENSQAYAMLGSLYFTIQWKSLALKYWEKSLEIDPDNREVDELVTELRNRQ